MDFALGTLEFMGQKGVSTPSQLLEHLVATPSIPRSKVKSVIAAFGDSDFQSKLMAFMSHRGIYMLGGLHAASEELAKSTNPEMHEMSNKLARTVAVVRQMISQLGTADAEFCENNSWVLADKDDLKSTYINDFVPWWSTWVLIFDFVLFSKCIDLSACSIGVEQYLSMLDEPSPNWRLNNLMGIMCLLILISTEMKYLIYWLYWYDLLN